MPLAHGLPQAPLIVALTSTWPLSWNAPQMAVLKLRCVRGCGSSWAWTNWRLGQAQAAATQRSEGLTGRPSQSCRLLAVWAWRALVEGESSPGA